MADLEALKVEKVDGMWLVSCGPLFCGHLSSDEALWVVANFLMGKQHHWLNSYEDHVAVNYRVFKEPITGLL